MPLQFNNMAGILDSFIQSVAQNPYIQAVLAGKNHAKTTGGVSSTVADLGNTFAAPFRDVGHVVAPNLIQAETPEQYASAQRGAEFGMGALQGKPEADALVPSVGVGLDTAKTGVKAGVQDVRETMGNAAIQPGGLERGSITPSEFFNPSTPQPGGILIDPKTNEPFAVPQQKPIEPEPQTGDQILNPARGKIINGKYEPTTINYSNPSSGESAGLAPTQLNPNAEKLPPYNGQSNPIPPTRPFPDTPDQPATIADRQGTHPVTGGNPIRLDFSDQAKNNNYYLEDQNKAQAILDKYVAGDTPLEVQENLPLQQQEEAQRIKNIIATNPSGITKAHPLPISKQSLIDENTKAMQKQGIELGDNQTYDSTNKALLKKLDTQLNPGQSNLPPNENIDGSTLQEYIKNLDSTLQSAYKKLDNGTTLSDAEQAALTMRRTASNILKSRYPEAAEALDRQSGMFDANPYVAKAASAEMKTQNADAIAAKEAEAKATEEAANKNANIPPFLRGIATQLGKQPPWLKTAEVATGGYLGINELKNIPNQFGALAGGINSLLSQKKDQITPPVTNEKPIYSTTTPLDDGTVISQEAQTKRQNALTSRIGSGYTSEQYTNPQQYSKDVADLANDEREFNQQDDLRGVSETTQVIDRSANNAVKAANGVDQGFFAALSKGYNSTEIQTNPKYVALAGYLKILQDQTGVPLNAANKKDSLIAGIDAAYQKQQSILDAAKTKYNGGQTPTPPPSNDNAPSSLPANPPNFNFGKMIQPPAGGGPGLPPFDQLFR